MPPITPNIKQEVIVNRINDNQDRDPYALFIINDPPNEYIYTVRIIACIPVEVGTSFIVEPPKDKKEVKTEFGNLPMRTIDIHWRKDIWPEQGPHTLWSITVQYTPEDDPKEDKGIRVRYKFGEQGPVKPRTSRGTVTTSSTPIFPKND